jgi:hypothetical protein
MRITLNQFERIDSLMSELLRAGEFMTCADPRGYVRTSNKLFDACVVATSYDFADDFASALECAAHIVTQGLLGLVAVVDEVAA